MRVEQKLDKVHVESSKLDKVHESSKNECNLNRMLVEQKVDKFDDNFGANINNIVLESSKNDDIAIKFVVRDTGDSVNNNALTLSDDSSREVIVVENNAPMKLNNNTGDVVVDNTPTTFDGSPILRKRPLNISPSTPIGLQRKLQTLGLEQSIKVITFDQDIEMDDGEIKDIEKRGQIVDNLGEETTQLTPGRKFIKALRRGSISIDSNRGTLNKQHTKTTGISVRNLKQKSKTKSKNRNYKSTRRKKLEPTDPVLDQRQRLIDEFYTKTPDTNLCIAGSNVYGDFLKNKSGGESENKTVVDE